MSWVEFSPALKDALHAKGIETLFRPNQVRYPAQMLLEPPLSLKWLRAEHRFEMAAFSYAVTGYFFAVTIGRYCSFGEEVQVGRQDHPTDWLSTSPFQYLNTKLFDIGTDFPDSAKYHAFKSHLVGKVPGTKLKPTRIGNDVWIGHGAFVRAGVTIGDGAVIAARAVVAKDVPPYAIVAGNPAQIKRFRVNEDLIPALTASQWWRYAPWDLQGLPFHNPEAFLDLFAERVGQIKPYTPAKLLLADLARGLAQ